MSEQEYLILQIVNILKKQRALSIILCNQGLADARKAIMELVDKLENTQKAGAHNENVAFEKSSSSFLASRSVDEDAEVQYPGSE